MTPSKSNSTEVFVLGRTFYLREINRGNNLPLYELNLHCMKGKKSLFQNLYKQAFSNYFTKIYFSVLKMSKQVGTRSRLMFPF